MTDPATARRELDILRRYLGDRNEDSYRVHPVTLAVVSGSFVPRVSRQRAQTALEAVATALDVADEPIAAVVERVSAYTEPQP